MRLDSQLHRCISFHFPKQLSTTSEQYNVKYQLITDLCSIVDKSVERIRLMKEADDDCNYDDDAKSNGNI